jgi:ABC-type sugar transport system permease subunit
MVSPEKRIVAVENYQRVFANQLFYIALQNAMMYVLGMVGPGTLSGLGLALLMQRLPRARVFSRCVFSPMPAVITTLKFLAQREHMGVWYHKKTPKVALDEAAEAANRLIRGRS